MGTDIPRIGLLHSRRAEIRQVQIGVMQPSPFKPGLAKISPVE